MNTPPRVPRRDPEKRDPDDDGNEPPVPPVPERGPDVTVPAPDRPPATPPAADAA